jgi:hypothetical protein
VGLAAIEHPFACLPWHALFDFDIESAAPREPTGQLAVERVRVGRH